MARKRSYDINTMETDYERKLAQQKEREAIIGSDNESAAEVPATAPSTTPSEDQKAPFVADTFASTRFADEYVNPDMESYKRMSLFMDWDTWERIQALCWSEEMPVNRLVVDKLREWSLSVPKDMLEKYRAAMKQKYLDQWAQERDVLQYWWQTSGLRNQMNIKKFQMNKNSLTVIEITGTEHNYYIQRGWVTDGKTKFAKEKIILAQLKRFN